MGFPWNCLLADIDPVDLLVTVVTEAIGGDYHMEQQVPYSAHIVHQAPGRVRLRIPSKRHDSVFFQDISERIMRCQNVNSVVSNPRTAGILVLYTGEISSLLVEAFSVGLAELVRLELTPPPTRPIRWSLASRLRRIDHQIARSTSGEADGGMVVVATLLVASAIQLWRGQIFNVIPLLWYAGQAIGGAIPTASSSATDG